MLDSSGALGALAGGLPVVLQQSFHLDLANSYRWFFIGYATINLISGAAYLLLSPAVEAFHSAALEIKRKVSAETKSIVMKISALFGIDSFGGGFLTDALVSYWFFRRFGIAENKLAALFFAVHV